MHTISFFLAVGRDPRRRDIDLALRIGYTTLLIPAGSRAIRLLATRPNITYVLDSAAYPPHNPERPSCTRYADLILAAVANERASVAVAAPATAHLAWAATYDHIDNPCRTVHDHRALQTLLYARIRSSPVVPVLHYPHATPADVVNTVAEQLWRERAANASWHVLSATDMAWHERPAVAIGGLVAARYGRAATTWLLHLLDALGSAAGLHARRQYVLPLDVSSPAAIDEATYACAIADLARRGIHLFGVSKRRWVEHPLVRSCDSSGPFRLARCGWSLARTYNYRQYGLSASKLQRSREACLALHLMDYRARLGLPFSIVAEDTLLDDALHHREPAIQRQLCFDSVCEDRMSSIEALPLSSETTP